MMVRLAEAIFMSHWPLPEWREGPVRPGSSIARSRAPGRLLRVRPFDEALFRGAFHVDGNTV